MARRKIVFVIVEGPSDEEALGAVFNRIYDRTFVYVHIMYGDMTTKPGVTADTVVSRIGREVQRYAKANHFTGKDFQEIIHLADTDGAYVPDTCITEDPGAVRVRYSETGITAKNKQAIAERNRQKRQNLDRLWRCPQIWKIPYRIFYLSCNLDHALYGKLNLTDEEKERYAYSFAKTYRERIPEFKEFITCSDFSVMIGYRTSWEYIATGTESLRRHTNLGLCFEGGEEEKTT